MYNSAENIYIAVVGTKPHISKIVTLQEKEKTYLTFNESQWNQTCFQFILGRFFWSIHHEIYTQRIHGGEVHAGLGKAK